MGQAKPELCIMKIMFPIESDEKALEVKKSITEVLKDNEDAQIHFSIMNQPKRGRIEPNGVS